MLGGQAESGLPNPVLELDWLRARAVRQLPDDVGLGLRQYLAQTRLEVVRAGG